MDDTKQEKTESQKSTDELLEERKADATDDETVRDMETSARKTNTGADNHDPGLAPDGSFDESDEIDNAGPM